METTKKYSVRTQARQLEIDVNRGYEKMVP
jgi:hypothetical protein